MKEKIIIAGLGNPGNKYEETRHNFGYMAVDKFAEVHNIGIDKRKGSYLFGTGKISSKAGDRTEVVLVKPLNYMNNSGVALRQALDHNGLDISSLLVIFDDLDLELGKMRLRDKGSSGGHRGIESIIEKLSTREFNRLKLGIGDQPKGKPSEVFVLEKFTKRERQIVEEVLVQALCVQEDFAFLDLKSMMQKYNGNAVAQLQLGEEL
ncbi:MAG: aminoacyl-tRNA hydrolase [Candidatus Marinimicrobia bacterium]|nr:aminoacyl-tRNA hydrolase [Candidatus Neomarinimicrobiota bacterium]